MIEDIKKSTYPISIITIKAIDKEGKLKKLIEYIKYLGNPGHSFGVILDPDIRENTIKWGWDGDGSDKIIDISEITEVSKDEEIMEKDEIKKFQRARKLQMRGYARRIANRSAEFPSHGVMLMSERLRRKNEI